MVPEDQLRRQLAAQYPAEDILDRASIMIYFDGPVSERTNRMWTRVRCYNVNDVPTAGWIAAGIIVAGIVWLLIRANRRRNGENYYAASVDQRRRKG